MLWSFLSGRASSQREVILTKVQGATQEAKVGILLSVIRTYQIRYLMLLNEVIREIYTIIALSVQ
jgi:hypothetical protein